jgi:hypothetical protein
MLHNSFISAKRSTCFRLFLRPSSRAQKLYIQHRVFVKPLLLHFAIVVELGLSPSSTTIAKYSSNSLTNTRCCMYSYWAPDDWRRNRLNHIEGAAEINELCNVTSCWLYLKINLRRTGPWTLKYVKLVVSNSAVFIMNYFFFTSLQITHTYFLLIYTNTASTILFIYLFIIIIIIIIISSSSSSSSSSNSNKLFHSSERIGVGLCVGLRKRRKSFNVSTLLQILKQLHLEKH